MPVHINTDGSSHWFLRKPTLFVCASFVLIQLLFVCMQSYSCGWVVSRAQPNVLGNYMHRANGDDILAVNLSLAKRDMFIFG